MLSQSELTAALDRGTQQANKCSRLCRVVGSVGDGQLRVAHNGIGRSSTDEQIIITSPVTDMTVEQLGARILAWLTAVHNGKAYDIATGTLS